MNRYPILALISLLALSACSSKPAPDLYVLRPSGEEGTCKTRSTVAIARPEARAEYDTKRIAVLLGKNNLTYYTGAAWASPFPDQLQQFLIDDFSRFQNLTAVEDAAADGSTVSLTIHEANVRGVDAPSAHLRLTARMYDGNNHLRTTLRIKETVPAEANHTPEIIDAFTKASAIAAEKLRRAMKLGCGES